MSTLRKIPPNALQPDTFIYYNFPFYTTDVFYTIKVVPATTPQGQAKYLVHQLEDNITPVNAFDSMEAAELAIKVLLGAT